MKMRLVNLMIPAVLAASGWVPAVAQIRIGVDLGAVRIRIAPDAPPPLRREIRSPRPDRSHVWIQGYWDRQGDRWAWSAGRWERPDQRGASWVRPRYRREEGAYRYEPGHWSHQRMVEGDDYSRWHREHGRGSHHRGGHGKGGERGNHHREP